MNIKEIAQVAGVSVATVSRVLNHPETVAPKTRERILNIMNQMDYKPNWFARGLNFKKN
jgi:DNA-binding LacI/PurR family transcriptional regulator